MLIIKACQTYYAVAI